MKKTLRLASTASMACMISSILAPSLVSAADLKLSFKNVPDKPGNVMIAVYDSADNFRKKPTKAMNVKSEPGTMQVDIKLDPGEYAVMVYHDQNDDKKLNTNMLGIPKEPWSGSLGGKSVLGAPQWDDVRFELTTPGKTVDIDFQ